MVFEPEQSTDRGTRRAEWLVFFISLAISAVLITTLAVEKLNFANWKDWFLVAGAIIWLSYTVIAGLSLVIDIDDVKDIVIERISNLFDLLSVPIMVIGGVLLFVSVFVWFSSIPSWAAVIITLLVLLLLRR